MKIPYILFLFLGLSLLGRAQEISIEKKFLGTQYTLEGERLSLAEIQELVQQNEEAFQVLKHAQSNQSIATVLGIAGGALLGIPIGTALAGGDANWSQAAIGAGLVAISIPFDIGAKKKIRQGVDLYNSGLPYAESGQDRFHPKWERRFAFGLRAGLNSSELDYNHLRLDHENLVAAHIAGFVEFKLIGSLHLQPEVQYSREGNKDAHMDYLNLPLLLKWYYIDGLYIQLGPQLGLLQKAEENEDFLKSENFSLVLGGGYETPGGLLFDLRFVTGTSSLLENDFMIPSGEGYNISGISAYPRSLQFGIGYKF